MSDSPVSPTGGAKHVELTGIHDFARKLLQPETLGQVKEYVSWQAAVRNGIINMGEVRFRPQEFGQFLAGNTKEENLVLQRIATRLVSHQRSTEPAPQAISVTLPEEGRVFTFSRRVQVKENAPLLLNMKLKSPQVGDSSSQAMAILVILALLGLLVFALKRKKAVA